jgi:hypothetical protein
MRSHHYSHSRCFLQQTGRYFASRYELPDTRLVRSPRSPHCVRSPTEQVPLSVPETYAVVSSWTIPKRRVALPGTMGAVGATCFSTKARACHPRSVPVRLACFPQAAAIFLKSIINRWPFTLDAVCFLWGGNPKN